MLREVLFIRRYERIRWRGYHAARQLRKGGV
jgi:hypothetical protein